MANSEKASFLSIALVSGKGGSGKTMIAAMLARLFDDEGAHVLLVDADFGTAGLTYYMGLNEVANISTGLTSLLRHSPGHESALNLAQRLKSFKNSKFIGIGDHRRYLKAKSSDPETMASIFRTIIQEARDFGSVVLFDCRGGIDEDSLAVCGAVDFIVVVAETDTTSFQSTQHLVDVLYDNGMSDKLLGFYINKVFDDPSVIAHNGTAAFRTQYLASLPFDLDATRSFILGRLPSTSSLFARQIWQGMYKAFPHLIVEPKSEPLNFSDFKNLTLRDRDSAIGGIVAAFASIVLGAVTLYDRLISPLFPTNLESSFAIFMLVFFAASGAIEPVRKMLGRAFGIYSNLLAKFFTTIQ